MTFFIFMMLLASASPFAFGQHTNLQNEPSTAAGMPSAEALKECFMIPHSATCLDHLFREALKNHSTAEVLKLIRRLEVEDTDLRRDCHPVVHAIGRETFRLRGNIHDSFSECDQTCHSGCYHGSVERFLRGEDVYTLADRHPSQAELKRKAAVACDPKVSVRLQFQCLHGLGHALMFFSRYRLLPALEACDVLPEDWSRSSCYGGVFMENVSNATPERRDLSAADVHYPCNKVNPKYRSDCYLMQTSRMAEMGLSTARLFEECRKAGDYRTQCVLSIGRDLSTAARTGDPRAIAEKCEWVSGEERLYCMHGVIYALIDNTWDGRYALPFCTAFIQPEDQRNCIDESVRYLQGIFEKSTDEIIKDCQRHLSQPTHCLKLTAR